MTIEPKINRILYPFLYGLLANLSTFIGGLFLQAQTWSAKSIAGSETGMKKAKLVLLVLKSKSTSLSLNLYVSHDKAGPKGDFFSESAICFSNLQNKYSKSLS